MGLWKATGSSTEFTFTLNIARQPQCADCRFNLSLYTHSADEWCTSMNAPGTDQGDERVNPLLDAEQFGRDLEFEVEDEEGTFRVYDNAPGVWVTFPIRTPGPTAR